RRPARRGGVRRPLAAAPERAVAALASSPTPRADAEELVSRLLGLPRSALYLERGRAMSGETWEGLAVWLRRRAAGEPVQYISGRAAFRDLDLAVGPAVLGPRPEAEGLGEAVVA